MIDTALDW